MTDAITKAKEALATRYRKKPVTVEAWQYAPQRWNEAPDWLRSAENVVEITGAGDLKPRQILREGFRDEPLQLSIKTLEGTMSATEGDWIIRGVAGELYPCKPEIFAQTYEPVVALTAQQDAGAEPVSVIPDHEKQILRDAAANAAGRIAALEAENVALKEEAAESFCQGFAASSEGFNGEYPFDGDMDEIRQAFPTRAALNQKDEADD